MEVYVSEFSKYIIPLLLTLYVISCFIILLLKKETKRSGFYFAQIILMFLFHFSSFLVICFETGELSYLFFYLFQQVILFAAIVLFKMLYPKINRLIINNMCMLLTISFIILTRLEFGKAIRQFIIVSVSLAISMFVPFILRKFTFLAEFKWIYAAAGILLLSLVLILGKTTYGSKISFSIAGVTFQPSEFVKIIFVFYVASALYKASGFFEVFTSAIVAAAHVIILVFSRDLGSALIFFMVYLFMVFIATKNYWYLIAGFLGGSAASYLAFHVFRHVQVRVQAWRDPWSVIDSAGYQITQSLFAISGGGWFGLGLFKGTPESIPFVEADFIFSAIAEEFGIIFSIDLILLCLSCFIMFMRVSAQFKDKLSGLIVAGLGITYIFQIFLTIGGGTKFIPLTGVTLPLISYGGSSVFTTIIMFIIIEGLYLIRQDMLEKRKQLKVKNKKELFDIEIEDLTI